MRTLGLPLWTMSVLALAATPWSAPAKAAAEEGAVDSTSAAQVVAESLADSEQLPSSAVGAELIAVPLSPGLDSAPFESPPLGLPAVTLKYSSTRWLPAPWEVPTGPPTRFDTALAGADRGAYAGMLLGFIGTQSAMWSQRTSWALMGAGAALGALWGGTLGKDSPSLQLRIQPDRWRTRWPDQWDPGNHP